MDVRVQAGLGRLSYLRQGDSSRDSVLSSHSTRTRMRAMKANRRAAPRARHEVVRPDNACPECGAVMKERRSKLTLPVNGEEIAVPEATHLRCPKGHEVVLQFDDARRLRQRALEIYREKYGLLTADDIHSIRERHGVTQAENGTSAPTRCQHYLQVGSRSKRTDGVNGHTSSDAPGSTGKPCLLKEACSVTTNDR